MSTSSEDHPEQAHAPVYDFLYQDAPRIGSLLAQLGDGPLQAFKRVAGTASTDKQEASYGGKLGTAGTGAHRTDTEGTGSEIRESVERAFDPLWGNALQLLSLLDSSRVLRRGLAGAGIGQCVIAEGSLIMMDIAMLREFWKRPSIQKWMKAEAQRQQTGGQGESALNRAERRRQEKARERERSGIPTENEIGLELVDLLPHTIQGSILEPYCEAFFTVQSQGLTVPPGDLLLKHGIHLGQGWNVLGIVDAIPGLYSDADIEDMVRVTSRSMMGQVIANIAFPVRDMMGRPATAYSLTPLLIYRAVAQPDDWQIIE